LLKEANEGFNEPRRGVPRLVTDGSDMLPKPQCARLPLRPLRQAALEKEKSSYPS
jgi:hypothetical protein